MTKKQTFTPDKAYPDTYSEAETDARREATLKQLLSKPHDTQDEVKRRQKAIRQSK